MVDISFISPLDQPTGHRRLLDELKDSLKDGEFSCLRIVVAFAKVGPLLRLQKIIESRKLTGFKYEVIFGVDQQGTSAQALTFALDHFDAVYITREPNMTFHPKIYEFLGVNKGQVFVGSNNLTVGGTETNFEAAIRLDLSLPRDATVLADIQKSWNALLPANCPATKQLDRRLLSELIADEVAPDEEKMRTVRAVSSSGRSIPKPPRSGLKVKPPSALPARKVPAAATVPISATRPASVPLPVTNPYSAQGIAMQIKPHRNGEIFLSVRAALQNPAFFKWPFTGATVPKKGGNTAYPQMTPDPRIDVVVYGAPAAPILTLSNYALNTVYYEKNSEIRITASPLVGVVPDYSIMIMEKSNASGIDYDLTIHTPSSPDYGNWLSACNQQMPSGGSSTPRKFGWF